MSPVALGCIPRRQELDLRVGQKHGARPMRPPAATQAGIYSTPPVEQGVFANIQPVNALSQVTELMSVCDLTRSLFGHIRRATASKVERKSEVAAICAAGCEIEGDQELKGS